MSIQVAITPQINARFSNWNCPQPTQTLVLSTHGMQNPAFVAPPPMQLPNAHGIPPAPIPPRNYAFVVQFNRSLDNLSFTPPENWGNLTRWTNSFLQNSHRFSSRPPFLHIYPFLFAQNPPIKPALANLAQQNLCDVLYFKDLTPGNDSITFEQLLNAPYPGAGRTFAQKYSNFLLLCCRSSTPPFTIGFGGAQEQTPDGLYRTTNANRVVAF